MDDKQNAGKDMIFGALWCIGGLIGSFANTGYIFWGAVLFGGIKFMRGLTNSF
jgi:hypothetical protein|nr:hypothetical protein [uncultured Flavobacterium sp.]